MCLSDKKVPYDGIEGYESYWYVGSRELWVKVWESRDEHRAMSVVPIPEKGAKDKEDISVNNIKNPRLFLTIGVNPRSDEKQDDVEDPDKAYNNIIKQHNRYRARNMTVQGEGGLDKTRSLSIARFDRLAKDGKIRSQMDEFMQLDMVALRTYDTGVLRKLLKDKKYEKKVTDALDDTIGAVETYAAKACYVLIAWGKDVNDFLRSHQDYAMKLREALKKPVTDEKVFAISIDNGFPYALPRGSYNETKLLKLDELDSILGLDGSEKE